MASAENNDSYQIKEDDRFWRIVKENGDYVKDKNGNILESKFKFKGVRVFKTYGTLRQKLY